ncbi:hypothetical protein HDU76_002933 [Blyttiomyces sp. JEL0837]|nr:hypothetical protein HDU76_002933 [Blyttiomyces sp. JEL0837]
MQLFSSKTSSSIIAAILVGAAVVDAAPTRPQLAGKNMFGKTGHKHPALSPLSEDSVNCYLKYIVRDDDLCLSIASANKITLLKLQEYNPKLQCDQLHEGDILCIAPNDNSGPASSSNNTTTTTGTAATTTASGPVPSPTDISTPDNTTTIDPLPQITMDQNCTISIPINENSTCSDILTQHQDTLTQGLPTIYKLNSGFACPIIGLYNGQSLCISSPAVPESVPTPPTPPPVEQPAQQPAPPPQPPVPAAAATNYVDLHNQIRQHYGVGNMLSLSPSLEATAMQKASYLVQYNGCTLDHMNTAFENLYGGSGPAWFPADAFDINMVNLVNHDAIKGWTSEGFDGYNLNHASQVTWYDATQVGCGAAFGDGCMVFCCHYDVGNIIGVSPSAPVFGYDGWLA